MESEAQLVTLFATLRERLSTPLDAPAIIDGMPMMAKLYAGGGGCTQQTEGLAVIGSMRDLVRARRRRIMECATSAKASVDAVYEDGLRALQTERYTRQEHVQRTHASALRRLRALFVECVAEMDKATKRAHKVAAVRSIETTSPIADQVEALQWNAQWRQFLSRLEMDTRCAIKAELIGSRGTVYTKIKEDVAEFLKTSGPTIATDHITRVDTIITVYGDAATSGDAINQDERRSKLKSTVHFFDSSLDAWNEVIGSTLKTQKRRPASSGTQSARRAKSGSLAPRQSRSADRVIRFARTEDGKCSPLRQIAAPYSARLSTFSFDVQLSLASIRWLLPLSIVTQLRDTCIYFALSDYRFNEDDAHSNVNESGVDWVKTRARHLYSLKSARDTRDQVVPDVIEDLSESVYVRATLVELLQTNYFSSQFLPLIGDGDSDLDKRYPPSIRKSQTINSLYIALDEPHPAGCKLVALEETCLQELCVTYVARGRCGRSNPGSVVSLAQNDALNIIPSNRSASHQFCVIRNPQLLIDSLSSQIQRSRSYEWLFVEFHTALPRATATPVRQQSFAQAMMRLISAECSWRSCMDSATSQSSHHPPVCHWHQLLRSSVNVPTHYISKLSSDKGSPEKIQELYTSDALRKMLIKASSLLEELSSRQLGQSVETFVSHVKQSMSSYSYNYSNGGPSEEAEAE